ncbi:MAG: alpha/beta fold hydrolase [Deltaproteobacteria bacterium]|nr:alpha/beta fold hydrolase [Deltaproteobacteria bacterium]
MFTSAPSSTTLPWRRRVALAVALGAPLFALAIGARTFRRELAYYRPKRRAIARPTSGALAHARDFRFGRGDTLRGWFVPPRNGAAVIFLHGSGADRTQLLPEAELLATHGFGVLVYDSPGHGESAGVPTWDAPERAALDAALDALSAEPLVDPHKIGVFGFSAGSTVATQVAAGDTRVRALVLAGTYAEPAELTRYQNRRWGVLSELPALWADAWAGSALETLRPRDVIAFLSPRPLLVLCGENDQVVPREQTERLFDAAREPKTLIVVPDAGHGDFLQAQPALVGPALLDFFTRNLEVRPRAAASGD